MSDQYDDIINLPRHVSKKRAPMAMEKRAAQFSPFAALTGHGEAVEETARVTQRRVNLDQSIKEELNSKLQILIDKIKEKAEIKITYFVPDKNKGGGSYIKALGIVQKIDEYEKKILMNDGVLVPIDDIISIEGKIFN